MRINLILNWRAMLARAQVRIIGIKRDLFWIPFGVILPLLGVSTFIFIYKSLNVPEFAYGFVILGGAMIAYWLNILWAMASQLCWERMTGNLPHIFHRTLFYKQYSCRYGSWRYGGYISEGCLYYYWCISFKIPINFNNIWISLCLLNNIGSPLWSWHDALKCFSTFRERGLASCKSSSRTYLSFLCFFPVRVFPFIVALFGFFTSHYFGA
ncbi:MAG: hypothetical protein ABDH34_03635 [Dictyoglomus thermophilum]|uniref:hypothetical protein n=1 Tax=Dictyoglomus thermophilum TaxID=14 RepID=UPI0016547CDB|nr:hypothetical protein [Dictyoglomus thermophilum]